jgi:hypothetical protein
MQGQKGMLANNLTQRHIFDSLLQVRCDRRIPRCGRCTTHEAECSYPIRQKKKTRKPARTTEISALFERLQRVEDVFQTRNGSALSLPPVGDLFASNEPSPQMPTPASLPEAVTSSQIQPSHPLIRAVEADLSNDVYMSLKAAVDQVQTVKVQKVFHAAKSTQEISIPKDLAKSWIRSKSTIVTPSVKVSTNNNVVGY